MLLAQATEGSLLGSLLPLVAVGAFVWFLMIRPQRKRAAERKQMMATLSVGSEVVTIGGIHGLVEALDDDTADLLVTEDIVLRFERSAIARIVTAQDHDRIDEEAVEGGDLLADEDVTSSRDDVDDQ